MRFWLPWIASFGLALPAASAPLAPRQYSGSTSNQLVDGTACRAVTVIYARGTNELGNLGDPLSTVGPPFLNALAAKVGSARLAVQGVSYSANVFGFWAGGDSAGTTTTANHVATAASRCPNTKIVLAGFSQGGQLIHKAASKLSKALTDRISAVLIFGDPLSMDAVGQVPSSKVKIICRENDSICNGGFFITAAHFTYPSDVGSAADWVAGKVA